MVALLVGALAAFDDPFSFRAACIIGGCLVLWLTEVVPPFVPTLVLATATPLFLGGLSPAHRLGAVLGWAADPVLALFLGGFTLGVAASRTGIDRVVAELVVRASRGRWRTLIVLVALGTAALSMWMSNIAAAAMMLASVRPLVAAESTGPAARRALLLAVALGANLGGMATPIGTGPNAIAIAALEERAPIDFVHWMAFALPLTLGMLGLGLLLLLALHRPSGRIDKELLAPERPRLDGRGHAVVVVFSLAVVAWLSEPFHGVSSAVVAMGATAVLFGSGLLGRADVARIDWPTLLLIAGGIMLGELIDTAGFVTALSSSVDWSEVPGPVLVLAFVGTSALLSALMSNTAAATMLVPLALSLHPSPSVAVLVAIGASFGMPFVISTPPNAMVAGEGLRSSHIVALGLPLMILGIIVVSLTGEAVLTVLGVR